MKADSPISSGAISIYGQNDAMDDFPVLKAFQQYIDAEQAKARKRLITLGIFFGVLMGAVIAVFVIMLMGVTARNQALNDRLIEFAMQERNQRNQPAVVVQPPLQQDNSALLAVTAKLDEMQKRLAEKDEAEKKARLEAEKVKKAEAAQKPKPPAPDETEIARLKALLAAEKEKVKKAELEAYRRKHYPELYAPKPAKRVTPAVAEEQEPALKPLPAEDDSIEEALEVLEELEKLDDSAAINYFDAAEEEEVPVPRRKKVRRRAAPKAPAAAPSPVRPENDYYSIPVDIRGVKSNWSVPND